MLYSKMTFVNEDELKKQNKVVKQYLNNRKLLKQKLQNETIAKQQLQKNAEEIFSPITKTFEDAQKKTDEIQNQLIQNIQQHLAIEEKPKPIYSVNFEQFFSDEEKQLLQENGFGVDLVKIIEKGPKFINELKDKTKEIN